MTPTILCPCCGHPLNVSREVERLVGCNIKNTPTFGAEEEGDVATTLNEVRRLDDIIHQLKQDRARLLRRVNNHQATTRHLPPEVLSTIFQFARPPIDFGSRSISSELSEDERSRRDTCKGGDFQLVLGAVSHQWRQVAWATPQLWTTASVEVRGMPSENSLFLLNLYFENSRSHPMTLELDFRIRLPLMLGLVDFKALEESTLFLESVKNTLLSNAPKIRNFIATGLPTEWTSLMSKTFLQCESMVLRWPSSSSSSSFTRRWRNISGLLELTELPNLCHFRVKNPYVPFTLPWLTITTLQLSGVGVGQGVESLTKCSNLVKFESQGLQRENTSPSLNQPVTLEQLELLTWCAYDDGWTSALLRHMRFSKLRVLKWRIRPYTSTFSEEFNNELVIFFSSLPETLQVLELDHTRYGYRMIRAIFISVSHLVELVLNTSGSPYFPYSMPMSMIGHSAAGIEDAVERRAVVDANHLKGARILPCLRKLTLLDSVVNMGQDDVIVIIEMLGAMHGARVMQEGFCLEMIEAPRNNIWGPEVLRALKEVAGSGFEFEILLGSHRLDYMSCSVGVICE